MSSRSSKATRGGGAILGQHHDPVRGLSRFPPIAQYIYESAARPAKRAVAFGGARPEHMIIMPEADLDLAGDALVGAGYGAAGELLHGRSRFVPGGARNPLTVILSSRARIRGVRWARITRAMTWHSGLWCIQRKAKSCGLVEAEWRGRELVVTARLELPATGNGVFVGAFLFGPRDGTWTIYKTDRPCPSPWRGQLEGPSALHGPMNLATALRSSPATGCRGATFCHPCHHRDGGHKCRSWCRWGLSHFRGGWKRSGFGDLNQTGTGRFRSHATRPSPRAGSGFTGRRPSTSGRGLVQLHIVRWP